MGYKSKFKGSTVVERLRAIPKKQDTLVSGQNIKTFNGESILEGGDISFTVDITYSELRSLAALNKLIPGQFYRITDYVTMVANSPRIRSVAHPFDLIVSAQDKNHLYSEAQVVLHSGDTYFANSRLDKWRVWYDINNDGDKYDWAAPDGKGVIYRMIDEFNNDCPYDFKNIQFSLDGVESSFPLSSIYPSTDGYYFTFSSIRNMIVSDKSMPDLTDSNLGSDYRYRAVGNVIYHSIEVDLGRIPRVIFFDAPYSQCRGNRLFLVQDIFFGTGCSFNTFKDSCSQIVLGSGCSYNTFGTACRNIYFGTQLGSVLASRCTYFNFGAGCTSITLVKGTGESSDTLTSGNISNLSFISGLEVDDVIRLENPLLLSKNYEVSIGRDTAGVIKAYCPVDGQSFNLSV